MKGGLYGLSVFQKLQKNCKWIHLLRNFHVRRPASTGSSGASNAGGASLESRVARLERNFKAGFR